MFFLIFFIIILPIIILYTGSYVEYVLEKNLDIDCWYRTPTRMLCFMGFLGLTLLSITVGIYRLFDIYQIL